MQEISLTINGENISCRPGTSILDAATDNGIKIPTLCHHPHLAPVGACRLCLVEDEDSGRIMASCVTPASSGMAIQTDSATIRKHRTNIIRLLMANHPESCIVCNQGNRCELRQIAAELGVGSIGLYPMPHYTGLEGANPFIIRDLSKCILCGKCIRADHELVVVGAIDYNLRGFKSRPATVHALPLEESNCTFCGTCVSICPTGALVTKNTRYVGSPEKESPTICGFCGVGCSLLMGSVDGQVIDSNPSQEVGTVNRSTLCIRGHFANDFLNAPQRLTTPLIKRNSELSSATWDEALDLVAERLNSVREKNGPQSIGFLGSSKCSNEENYLFQRIARATLGTNNVDNGSHLAGRSTLHPLNKRLGEGGQVTSLPALEHAEVIFVIGGNPTHSLPVVGYYLKRASSMKGVPLLVADPRRIELVPFSTLWLPLAPQSDSELINALASILYGRGAHDAQYLNRYTKDFDLYREGLAAFDIERASRATGVNLDLMEKTADLLQGKRISFVVGKGVLQQRRGIETMDALLNLALLTGSLGREGRGIYFLAMENNQLGAWDMGTVPDFLPGRQLISVEGSRKYWEQAWGVKISPDPGLNVIRMIEEAEKGNLKAIYVMGENLLRGLPEPGRVRKALSGLEFLVVQDILSNETTELADVVLPGAAFSEKSGCFTNMEGRIQCFEPVVSPPADAKPDWEILNLLAQRMGHGEPYSSIERIRAEIRRNVPMYANLGQDMKQAWIKPTSHLELFSPQGEGGLIPFTALTTWEAEAAEEGYPFKAILGSLRSHLGSGTRTGLSERIRDFGLKGEVEMSPEDAKALNLQQGDKVRVSSPQGSVSREITIKRSLRPGVIFIPTAFEENNARHLIKLTPLGTKGSPGWKLLNVNIERT
ncbi:MAG: molybdopterin-dependent oxidoreductase [Desulfobacteraceae bacterium]